MNLDKVTISIKSGNGGSGKVSFHREKYIEKVDLQEEMEVEAEVFILSAVHPSTPY